MRQKQVPALLVCILLVTAVTIDGVFAQDADSNDTLLNNIDSSGLNLLEFFDNFDVQKTIRDLQKDGTLLDLASSLAVGSFDEYPVNKKCVKDMLTTLQALFDGDRWAINLIDSIGKPHSGILSDLDFNWYGSFDECVGVKAITYSNDTLYTDPVHHFDGKYCTVGIPLPSSIAGSDPILQAVGASIKLGVCVSDACHTEDMKNFLRIVATYVFNASSTYKPDATCHDGFDLDTKAIVAICILSILGLVVVIGTLYDIYLRLTTRDVQEPSSEKLTKHTNEDKNGDLKVNLSIVSDERLNGNIDTKIPSNGELVVENANLHVMKPPTRSAAEHSTLEKIFLAFSIYSNGLKLLSTTQSKGALTCIHGMRFLSMTWVILGHSLTFKAKNPIAYWFMKKVPQWTFYGIFSATVSVDTFFTISGLLVSYLTLREMSKRGGAKKMNWFMFYFHRYWRLTPAYMLTLMVFATIFKYVGDGPKWSQDRVESKSCAITWWTNLLYVNNYVDVEHMCFGWSWYLANDMQFYVLSPLILVPLYYNAVAGGVVAFLFFAGTTVARAVIAKEHEYTALFGGFVGPRPKDGDFMKNMYFPAHTRMSTYIVGLLAGYLLYRYKDTVKLKKVWNLLGWLCSMATIVLVIYGVYPDDGKHYLTVNESVAYVTLHRTAWALAVSWIIFACATGNGGWINDFLSWSPFGPLGRMSYCAYLVHLIVLNYYTDTARSSVYLTDLELIYFYIGNVVLSYFVAFGTSLLFEAPMMGLEKVMFKRR